MRSLHGAGLDPVTNRKAKLFELWSRVDSFNDGDANFGLKYVAGMYCHVERILRCGYGM